MEGSHVAPVRAHLGVHLARLAHLHEAERRQRAARVTGCDHGLYLLYYRWLQRFSSSTRTNGWE